MSNTIYTFGTHLKLQESPKSKLKHRKKLFTQMIQRYEAAWVKSNLLFNEFGIDLINYEEDKFLLIEDLIYYHFGEVQGRIIIWYVIERIDPNTGKIGTLTIAVKDKEGNITQKEHNVRNIDALWKILQKFNKIIK